MAQDLPVGRIRWTAIDLGNGSRAEGDKVLALSGVTIKRMEITRRSQMITELTAKFQSERGHDFQKMVPGLEEIQIRQSEEEDLDRVVETWFSKSAHLDERFALGYDEHLRPRSGFGLVGSVAPEKLFCWEWFNVEDRGRAIKLQESGLLHFDTAKTPSGEEISHMRFESDVSIRLMAMTMPPTVEPLWRINILAGSEIWWPFLAGEEMRASGFLRPG